MPPDYGIQNEHSDYRCHVCVREGALYLFETHQARSAIERGNYRQAFAGQDEVVGATGRGYLVPPDDIPGCIRITIPPDLLQVFEPGKHEDTSSKGRKAERIFMSMDVRGLIPQLKVYEVDDLNTQLSGIDFQVKEAPAIQVKCDYTGGRRPKGTGNLFLQTWEINPRKKK